MKYEKKLICFGLLFCFLSFIQAQNLESTISSHTQSNQKVKFGLQTGVGLFYFFSKGAGIASSKTGGFGEYQLLDCLGIQTGLMVYYNSYSLHILNGTQSSHFVVTPIHLLAPIVLRIYPGKDRQSCFFGGTQMGYLISGRAYTHKTIYKREQVSSISLTSNQLPVNKVGISLLAGYDYEFRWGLILGLTYIHDYVPVMRAEQIGLEWSIQSTIGYNFAKLF